MILSTMKKAPPYEQGFIIKSKRTDHENNVKVINLSNTIPEEDRGVMNGD